MSTFKLTSLVFIFSAAIASVSGARAQDIDPNTDGYVMHVDDHQLKICYRTTPPEAGSSVQILAVTYITLNKMLVRPQFHPSGTARITEIASNNCVRAELIDGDAGRSYHARLLEPTRRTSSQG